MHFKIKTNLDKLILSLAIISLILEIAMLTMLLEITIDVLINNNLIFKIFV